MDGKRKIEDLIKRAEAIIATSDPSTELIDKALSLLNELEWTVEDRPQEYADNYRLLKGTHPDTGSHVITIDEDGLFIVEGDVLHYVSTPQIDQWAKNLFNEKWAEHDLHHLLEVLGELTCVEDQK